MLIEPLHRIFNDNIVSVTDLIKFGETFPTGSGGQKKEFSAKVNLPRLAVSPV